MISARVMDGRIVAQEIKARVKSRVEALDWKHHPILVTIRVGEFPAASRYLKNVNAACGEVGIASRPIELSGTISQSELVKTIAELNKKDDVTGILLQSPLPAGLGELEAISAISAEKDVDGLTPHNLGLVAYKAAKLVPCTPKAVIVLLHYYGVPLAGAHAVVVNRSTLVGRPLMQLLLNEHATVTVAHSKTRDLPAITREADVLVTAIGRRPEFTVTPDMIKPGAVVVDVGTSMVEGKMVGDVDFSGASEIASFISPVPGGVGPVTIAMLLHNALSAACLRDGLEIAFDPAQLTQQNMG
jgi:methylenetetrahydrofolate dehydrogenase (NADP+)/methenyltetrahydrofolate cyclohydrolase